MQRYNKQCQQRNVTPQFINTNIPLPSHTSKYTHKKIQSPQFKHEIRVLYTKKQNINQQLFHCNLKLPHTWGNNGHSFGEIKDIMTPHPPCYNNKGVHLNTMERFYIYQAVNHNNHINDKCRYSEKKYPKQL